jgi:hypothetical protein
MNVREQLVQIGDARVVLAVFAMCTVAGITGTSGSVL